MPGLFSRRHVKNFTASLRRLYGIAPYNCGVIKPNTMLQPNKIARTVYPDQPAKDFNEFMAHNAKTTIAAVVDEHKERFDVLWAAFTRDIQRNSDPKLLNGICPKCQIAEFNSTIQRPTSADHV